MEEAQQPVDSDFPNAKDNLDGNQNEEPNSLFVVTYSASPRLISRHIQKSPELQENNTQSQSSEPNQSSQSAGIPESDFHKDRRSIPLSAGNTPTSESLPSDTLQPDDTAVHGEGNSSQGNSICGPSNTKQNQPNPQLKTDSEKNESLSTTSTQTDTSSQPDDGNYCGGQSSQESGTCTPEQNLPKPPPESDSAQVEDANTSTSGKNESLSTISTQSDTSFQPDDGNLWGRQSSQENGTCTPEQNQPKPPPESDSAQVEDVNTSTSGKNESLSTMSVQSDTSFQPDDGNLLGRQSSQENGTCTPPNTKQNQPNPPPETGSTQVEDTVEMQGEGNLSHGNGSITISPITKLANPPTIVEDGTLC